MSKKIILLINSMADGGAEKLVQSLLERLYNEGFSIELICIEKDDVFKVNENIKVTYFTDWDKNTSGIKKLIFLPLFAFKLSKYIKNNHIKIVQSHLFRANYVNLLAKLLFKSKHSVQVVNHSVISRYKQQGVVGGVNLFLIKNLYPFADKIISVSNIVQDDMQKLFDFTNEKKVIYNMFDIEQIKRLSSEAICDFKFDGTKKYIISVGRLISLKRNQDLLCTLSKVDSNVELLFIGEGEERNNLEKLSIELSVSSRVHFIGWVDNPYKYMYHSNVLVCTSQTESFGNVLVEAMACGVPVVSTKCGGPEEIIDDGVNGFLVEIGDIDSLVEKINLIFSNNELSNKFILNVKKKVKIFDKNKIIKEYKEILEGKQ